MKDNYLITVVGKQIIDGDEDVIEVTTTGNYEEKNGNKYISYQEYDNDNTNEVTDTLIEIAKDNTVTITKTQEYKSSLILEKGKKHQCHYKTPLGEILMGIYTKDFYSDLSTKGGSLVVKYQIDFYTNILSENEFKITIEENSNVKDI